MGYVILNGVNSPFLLGMRPLAYRTAPGRFFVALVLSCAGLSAVTRLGIAQGPAFRVAHLVEGSARAATPRGVIVSRTTLFAPDFLGSVIKTVSDVNGGNLVPGDTLEYVITATNSGTTNAKFVIFIDAIPTNSTYVTSSLRVVSGPNTGAKTDAIGDDQAQFEAPQNRVRFRLGIGATGTKAGTILTGASTSWRFRTTVNPAVAVGTIISNIGTLSFTDSLTGVDRLQLSLPPGGIAVGEPTTIPVTAPDLTIAKSHTGTFLRGQNATYTLVVTNVGNGVTTAISSVSDVLPAGLTPVAAAGGGLELHDRGSDALVQPSWASGRGGELPPDRPHGQRIAERAVRADEHSDGVWRRRDQLRQQQRIRSDHDRRPRGGSGHREVDQRAIVHGWQQRHLCARREQRLVAEYVRGDYGQ